MNIDNKNVFYRIELARLNQGNVILGTVPTVEDMDFWFSTAYAKKRCFPILLYIPTKFKCTKSR